MQVEVMAELVAAAGAPPDPVCRMTRFKRSIAPSKA
jgi:hypothetical protein